MRLVDASVLIDAKDTYYAFDLAPQFWTGIEAAASKNDLGLTDLVWDELAVGNDELSDWVRHRKDLLLKAESTSQLVATCVDSLHKWAKAEGYKPHVLRDFMTGADPFLVGAAHEQSAVIVTSETPAGSKRKKVKIPDACGHLGVQWENTFEMMRNLGLSL